MNSSIGFKNMKVLKDKITFDFKEITLFTGVNNSGKSSVINALQLLQESITSYNLDGILKAEFKTRKNKNKYGSVKTFVNNSSNLETNYFIYYQIENDIEYQFKIELNEGIETFGKISSINAFHLIQKVDLFNLKVITPYGANFSCELNINFNYFVESFLRKCQNTQNLINEIPKLKQICNDLNSGIMNPLQAQEIADVLSKKYSTYIDVFEGTFYSNTKRKKQKEWTYLISSTRRNTSEAKFRFNDVGVLFNRTNLLEKFEDNLDEFNSKYSQFINYGIFDFDKIWEIVKDAQQSFEHQIESFYNTEIQQAYLNFSNDLLLLLSSSTWTIQEKYSAEDLMFLPSNLIEKFIGCFEEDFGLFSTLLKSTDKTDDEKPIAYLGNSFLMATQKINFDKVNPTKLNNDAFFKILESLSEILLDYINGQKNARKNIIQNNANEKINQHIKTNLNAIQIKKNYAFVSSTRYSINRTHFYEDGSELTKLLNELEKSPNFIKTKCYDFINKWLRIFDIADEMVLIPDDETGNFKIYLKQNKKKVLLADYGLGTNQLLPIIFSLSLHRYTWDSELYDESIIPKTVVIEEPESNLHPSMQSKLAEMFIEAIEKFKVKIIAETHSEYLIRKLQYLIAKKESSINSENVVIYYFYKTSNESVKSKKVKQVEKIEIDKFGRLSKEFGGGFFDEADNSALELFLLNQYNKN